MLVGRGIGRVGGPGLIGTAARTAVVAGTATAVVGGVSHHQQAKAQQAAEAQAYEQQQQELAMQQAAQQAAASQMAAQAAAAPAVAPAAGTDVVTQLKQLAELKEEGILTEAEFAAQKAKVLGS